MYHTLIIVWLLPLISSVNNTSDISDQKLTLVTLVDSNITHLIEKFRNSWPVTKWIENGYFSEEYISDINIHWLKYPPPEPTNFFVIGIIYIIIMTVGVAGNILVLYLFFR